MEEHHQKRHRDAEGEDVRNGLAELHARQAPDAGQRQDQRDEAEALTAAGQKGRPAGFADALEHHVRHDDEGLQEHGQTLVAQRGQRHGGDEGVVAEQPDECFAVEPAQAVQHTDEAEGCSDGEDACLPHPAVFHGPVVEGRHGLQALPHANGHGQHELEDAGDDAHAGHGGVAVAAGGNVQQHAADAVQALPAKAGGAVEKDLGKIPPAAGDGRELELADGAASQKHGQQDAKADALAQGRGKARAAGAHAEPEDEHRVQRDVQQAACDQADHGKAGLALVAEDVVHHQAGDHHRRSAQDGPRIGAGVGQDRLGAAQQHHEIGQGGKAAQGQNDAESQRREKAGGGKFCGGVGILAAQAAADDAAGTVAQHKAQRLDDGHQAGDHAYRARCAGGQLPYEKGISQVVDAGDEHAEDGGGRKAQDELRHRGLGHFAELRCTALFGLGCG